MENRPKILSIDDNDANQKLVERALGGDYDVKTAMSGLSGIEAAVTFKPDAILLDVDMPTIDGLRLCRMIRSEPLFASTPILFVSGLDSQEDQARGFQAGGDDYISKPIDVELLRQKLNFNLQRALLLDRQSSASNDSLALDQNTQSLHDFLLSLISFRGTQQELGQLVLDALDKLGLKGAVYLHASGDIFSSIGPLTDLESMLLQQATRPYPSEYSARYLWGSDNLGAIIQNMPLARHEQYQPLVQILTTLFSATNQKIVELARPTVTKLTPQRQNPPSVDYAGIQLHGYKLECALEDLENSSEQSLAKVCQRLQELSLQPDKSPQEQQALRMLLDDCMKTRLAIYDQCLEIQSQYSHIMAQLGMKVAFN
ncbi:response regulator [Saccharophagus sp. K07]|uniref:response regulator n=1 Tax=Saccharophagus sp. K07 TaxID=2283636 RepID=UPI0016521705|nr:response regulator [Saccharophagus sp. K07]MBC6903871.1 response regulator [Saccharophagus sp. K07]